VPTAAVSPSWRVKVLVSAWESAASTVEKVQVVWSLFFGTLNLYSESDPLSNLEPLMEIKPSA